MYSGQNISNIGVHKIENLNFIVLPSKSNYLVYGFMGF